MSLSRLYQSLDITEQVTAMFDELDAMLSLIALNHSSTEPAPKWFASSSTSVSDASLGCPLFVAMLKCDAPWEGITLLELRHIIFAHQILVALRIFEERLQRLSTGASDSSALQNLKTEYSVMLLRYASHCLNAVFEGMGAFKMSLNSDELQCWTIAFCLEALQLTSLLTEITHVEQAAHFICSLKLATCKAVS
ncbi:unnamed protein product [Gongylonema pulchrum]|uniref:Uncharacterized protein n=1 Tax=Gongylonema pulchrum TaxID=637853 RepID=A0A183D8V4_9BILA|nr:unnamed protein product [Gongylonema pulchrum]